MPFPNTSPRRGSDLRHPSAHARDHQAWSRRGFLRTIGLAGATTVGLSSLPLTGLFGSPLTSLLSGATDGRKLVLIRLKGGNDGLNTFVPLYDFDRYADRRPTLHVPQAELIGLDADFAVPRALEDLVPLWSDGRMKVVNSVGYPDSSLSHFTGADIVASGNSDPAENGDGWLARYYTTLNPDYRTDPPDVPPAIKIGGPTSILFNDADKVDISANFATPDGLEELAATGRRFNDLLPPDDCYHGEQVSFLRSVGNAAYRYSSAIFDAYNAGENGVDYTSSLGEQLRLVARLIKGGLPTQLYLVTLDGFDTHVGQDGSHPDLLRDVSEAVSQFYTDLALDGADEDVLTMTYSEFGRRVEQNGFGGTDHGTALPVMFFGPALAGNGFLGDRPDLDDLDATGNLRFGTDFRSLYATVLEDWFCLPAADVDALLGADYDRVTGMGFACGPTTSTGSPLGPGSHLTTSVAQTGAGRYRITVDLPRSARMRVELFTISGQQLLSVADAHYPAGTQQLDFSLVHLPIESVPLVYTVSLNGGQPVAKQFIGGRR